MNNSLTDYYDRLNDKKNKAAESIRAIFLYLKQQCPDLAKIKIDYDGSGDDGQVESICFYDKSEDKEPFGIRPLLEQPLPTEVYSNVRSHFLRFDPVNRPVYGPSVNDTPEQALDTLAWDLAYGQNPGFEDDEGGFGDISVSLDEDSDDDSTVKVTLSHHKRIEATEDCEYTF